MQNVQGDQPRAREEEIANFKEPESEPKTQGRSKIESKFQVEKTH